MGAHKKILPFRGKGDAFRWGRYMFSVYKWKGIKDKSYQLESIDSK